MSLAFTSFRWKEELAEQRALFSDCFPENRGLPPETEAFYSRKFRTFPHDPPSYEYLARDEGAAVGFYAALPFTYLAGDTRYRCGMVCDVMTSPRMQGKGVFTKLGAYSLGKLTDEGVDFVTGYPRRAAVIPGHLKVGWHIAFRLPMYLMPLRTDGLLRTKDMGKWARVVNPLLSPAHGLISWLLPSTRGLQLEIWDWRSFFDQHDDYEAFFARWRAGKAMVLDKTRAYLTWRLAVQDVDYRILTVKRQGTLVGLSIVRSCAPEGVPSLAVLDLMQGEEDPAILACLREGWRRLAEEWASEAVLLMMSEFQAQRTRLWRLGFLRTPVVFSLILNLLSARAKQEVSSRPEDWHLMWIDSDDL